tara:strand:+ start:532 stop:1674 length:1143 start_codon:yes stop_codon:yes gene_type:complete
MNGALANLPNNRNQPFSYNLIGQRTNVVPTFSSGRRFQDYIGTSALTSFPFVESIVTGQVQYNANNPVHRAEMGDYANWKRRNPDAFAPQVEELTGFASQLGESIGSSLITGGDISEGFKGLFGKTGMDVAKGTTTFPISALRANEQSYGALVKAGLSDGSINTDKIPPGIDVDKLKGITGRSELLAKGVPEGFDGFKARLTDTQQLKGAAGGAIGNFAVQLALGRDPVKAAKSAGAGAIGKILGNAIFPGFGGFIGGTLGSIIGGRVICNELMRQGLLTRKEVVLDYKFTRDYLTPTHVNGYHVWAVWMVKQMRKGKFVKFWKHVAGHRANEIAYIYGERDKPDYLGKIYRKILEPTCWAIGSFCKVTDWSVLYKQKEI